MGIAVRPMLFQYVTIKGITLFSQKNIPVFNATLALRLLKLKELSRESAI
jgi:hypothetical protein